jgi:hypothetical protein
MNLRSFFAATAIIGSLAYFAISQVNQAVSQLD